MRAVHGLWLALFLGIAALAVLYAFDPREHGFYPSCYWKRWTGLNCAGCGCLRATHHLLHGEVALAFRHNPLWVLSIPPALAWGAWIAFRRRSSSLERPPILRRSFSWVGWCAGVLILYTILRNIPALSPWLSPP